MNNQLCQEGVYGIEGSLGPKDFKEEIVFKDNFPLSSDLLKKT